VLALDWGGIPEPVDGANLILGWDLDADRGVALSLAKPVATWRYRGQPRLAWSQPVEFDLDDVPHFVVGDEDVDIAPKFDLDELGERGRQEGAP
jgi:hypothetical protein